MKETLFGSILPLAAGARVALVAPAGIVSDDDIERASDNVRSFGWEPLPGDHIRKQSGYLAGIDADRLHDINAAFQSEEVDAIWCLRGGYGTIRLLASIDYPALRRRPRPVIGFSDITALHSAIHRKCGIVTFHGPTARSKITDFSRESLSRALIEQRDPCGEAPNVRALRGGRVTGRVVGGNLALVAALIGTPFAPNFDGTILIIEDIGEAVYRIDRMLTQLLLAGALQRCAAIVAGNFRPPRDEIALDNRTVNEVLLEAAEAAGIPCLGGAPIGHMADQWTIPLGAVAELDTAARTLRVV